MNKTFIILIIFLNSAFAEMTFFDFNDQKFHFVKLDNDRITSDYCKLKDCLAKSHPFDRVKIKDGEDPAAVACIESKKAKIIQMHDGKQNEESICHFNDGSMLTFGSLRFLVSE